jgi:hypothetical protein
MNRMLTRREMIVAIGAVTLATPAWAVRRGADETFKGEMVCAKCFLNKPDAKECQDVLLVKDGGATTEYYITKNKVAQESGEACTQAIPAVVIGTVKETDGRKWLTASKITKG